MSAQDQTTANQGTGIDESLRAGDILETAKQLPQISKFVEAVQREGMATELRVATMRTLFAPVNAAFEAASGNAGLLSKHIVQGRQTEADLRTTRTVRAISGETVPVEFRSEGSLFGGAKIIRHDIPCRNGVIHLIDSVAE